MKRIIILLLCTLIAGNLLAQTDSIYCATYRKGYFSYTDSLGNTVLVKRLKNYQFEKNTVTQVKIQFHIEWLSNCSYRITQAITNSKSARKYKHRSTEVKISITKNDNGYYYSCNCPASEVVTNKGFMKKLTKQEYYSVY